MRSRIRCSAAVLGALLASVSHARSGDELSAVALHPLDSFTGYTLDRGEWVFNFPMTPGWLMWGVTDDLTVEIDAECWLGGVPSVNARLGVLEGDRLVPSVALESMYQYLPDTVDLLNDYEYLNVLRRGSSLFGRVNMSWKLNEAFAVHCSPGVTWSESLEINNGERSEFKQVEHGDLVQGDLSLGASWLVSDWLSAHASVSSGVTFVYLDNVPGKRQMAAGVRLRPFHGMSPGILRNMGAELAVVSISFPDVDEVLTGPMFYLFWQWK